jgi:hypothetical protein
MSQIREVPTKRVKLALDIPAEMTLPVDLDAGTAANGFQWSRFLDYAALEAMGIRIRWQDKDGMPVPREAALQLIQAMVEPATPGAHTDDGESAE